jgi:hypothetical protein
MRFLTSGTVKAQNFFAPLGLSMAVLLAGLMLAAVMRGQAMLDGARAQKLLDDVKHVEALIGQYSTQKGRLPGDCNRDNIVDYELSSLGSAASATAYDPLATGTTDRASKYDDTGGVLGKAKKTDTGARTTDLKPCVDVGGSAHSEDNANRWVNDLRHADVISRSTNNRLFTKHVAGDFMFVGKFKVSATEDHNAIAIAGVPIAAAKRILQNINGSEVASATGQMRVLTSAGEIEASAKFAARGNGETVSLIYFFRNQPVSS